MAITINDLKERLEQVHQDIDERNFGLASIRLFNLVTLLESNGILIHAVATVENKKVESNDGEEN